MLKNNSNLPQHCIYALRTILRIKKKAIPSPNSRHRLILVKCRRLACELVLQRTAHANSNKSRLAVSCRNFRSTRAPDPGETAPPSFHMLLQNMLCYQASSHNCENDYQPRHVSPPYSPSVRQSAWNNSATSRRILMKFHI